MVSALAVTSGAISLTIRIVFSLSMGGVLHFERSFSGKVPPNRKAAQLKYAYQGILLNVHVKVYVYAVS